MKLKGYLQFFESASSKLEVLKDHLKRTNIDLAKWIIKNLGVNIRQSGPLTDDSAKFIIQSVNTKEYWSKLPSMYFFDSPAKDIPDGTWLIHFTPVPNEIAKGGFIKGEPNFLKLGMNWGVHSETEGYNYGFLPEDVIEKYGSLESARSTWLFGRKGGAIFFKAPAIKAYHFGDEINQAIFWGPEAHEITPVTLEYGKWNYNNDEYKTLDDVYKIIENNATH
jgi:hypothetical protein